MLAALAALLAALPSALAGAFAGALAAGLLEHWLQRWQQDWPAALLCFCLDLPQPSGRGDPGYDVVGEDALIYFWSKNLLQICCIQDLFLRFEQRRRERWLGDDGSLGNLRGDSEQQERLPSWFAVSCKLRVHHAQSP
jgi:hypothetical protein